MTFYKAEGHIQNSSEEDFNRNINRREETNMLPNM